MAPINSMEPWKTARIFDRPGQPGVEFNAIRALAGRAAHFEAAGQRQTRPRRARLTSPHGRGLLVSDASLRHPSGHISR